MGKKSLIIRRVKNVVYTLLIPLIVFLITEIMCLCVAHKHVIANSDLFFTYVKNSCLAGAIAIALSFNLGNGRFDLSLGAQREVAVTIGYLIAVNLGMQGWGLIIFTIIFGLIAGFIVGFVFVLTRIPAMVLGIGMGLVLECIPNVLTASKGFQLMSTSTMDMYNLITGTWVCPIIVLIAMALTTVIDGYTKFGLFTRAIAGNQKIAHNSGINIFKHAIGCYTIAGGMVAISELGNLSVIGSFEPSQGLGSNATIMTNTFPMFLGRYIAKWSSVPIGILVATFTIQLGQQALRVLETSENVQKIVSLSCFLLFLIYCANKDIFKKIKAKKARIEVARAERAKLSLAK